MKEIRQKGQYSYLYTKNADIQATVDLGEIVEIYTEDAFSGLVKTEDDLPSKLDRIGSNPQTGPIYINGAKAGDTLAVTIHSIEFTRDYGVSQISNYSGALQGTNLTAMLHEPFKNKVYKYTVEKDKIYHPEYPELAYDVRPFLGTITTAPKLEAVLATVPFNQGGNMDVVDAKPGNIVYLPVAVDGAYFFTGDCHARQGDGEICGTAIEIPAKVRLSFDIRKDMKTKWPRIESPTHYMTVGSVRPLEDAARIAWIELISWMEEKGWDRIRAYQALTQIGEMSLGNLLNPNYSMVAKVEKKYADYFLSI